MSNDQFQIYTGDTRLILPTLADQSVQCIVTSPPYYGLRDYGTAIWDGGEADCDHKVDSQSGAMKQKRSTLGPKRDGLSADNAYFRSNDEIYRDVCGKCGAQRIDQQIGIESSPDEYVAAMVAVFHEARRVLHDSGTLWLNIGDSYASSPPGNKTEGVSAKSGLNGINGESGRYRATLAAGHATKRDTSHIPGIKTKDLLGIPWMVAFALRADGWYLRSDIIWNKPNPLPESVKDRPTSAHEHIFLLSKKPIYYYDADAIAEPMSAESNARYAYAFGGGKNEALRDTTSNRTRMVGQKDATGTRNARNVWTITPKPFKEAHFATMPIDLATRCVLAGSRAGDLILDPFGGAGTTAVAAIEQSRRAILIELNADYAAIAARRMQNVVFPEWAV